MWQAIQNFIEDVTPLGWLLLAIVGLAFYVQHLALREWAPDDEDKPNDRK